VSDTLDFMEEKFGFQDQIKKLKTDMRKSQDEVAKEVAEKQVTLAHKAIAEQALMEVRAELEEKRMKAEKDMDKYKEEKRNLEYIISDLVK
jgi:uncharacterized glyoxalase superfamily protein PhnB